MTFWAGLSSGWVAAAARRREVTDMVKGREGVVFDRLRVEVDDEGAVANAGLLLPATVRRCPSSGPGGRGRSVADCSPSPAESPAPPAAGRCTSPAAGPGGTTTSLRSRASARCPRPADRRPLPSDNAADARPAAACTRTGTHPPLRPIAPADANAADPRQPRAPPIRTTNRRPRADSSTKRWIEAETAWLSRKVEAAGIEPASAAAPAERLRA